MANKFTKSVLNRLEQEAQRQKKEGPPQETSLPQHSKEEKAERAVGEKRSPTKELTETVSHDKKRTENKPKTEEGRAVTTGHTKIEVDPAKQKQSKHRYEKSKEQNGHKTMPDISGYLRPNLQRTAKNKTFYLDQDVIEALKKVARQQQVTDSKLVNDILRQILSVDE